MTKPHLIDDVAGHLVKLLHTLLLSCASSSGRESIGDILLAGDVAAKLFWKHLYPATEDNARQFESGKPVLTSQTRSMLMDIILRVVQDDETQFSQLIGNMYDLVTLGPPDDGEIYQYELQIAQQFEREKAIRAECGYAGLRNLSNTCYFNSLYTQLFMNVDFRRFMLSATVEDPDTQTLLFNTQKTFAHLQDSIRRYITPEDCVASIRTYENTLIDVNVQMDVDEFFNLLFDRWEGQFSTEEEKNHFRSFYGGQLVQQVRSKECDHISERLEPFSAIQCDIKGKNTLQESLQAYVEGEIMEGDNKYKCSTCDKHVDAVKRTCLKTAPDNLIFHLKRFDFSLRTLQRSKINDWFSFPTTIDMRPYTMAYLSNPDRDQEEDLFELVGVLIHSGTAESGHYYSFVRERPSSNDGQTWVEFNDDQVTPWDPVHMEASCFGGPDYQPFQNNVPFDKQYSAYMLFYQRSSSLLRSQELLLRANLISPLRVEVPADMEEYIQNDNTLVLRRHCIYDPCQTEFVLLILSRLRSLGPGACRENHRMETNAIFMALGHLDQVTSRMKDTPKFPNLVTRLRSNCQNCVRCSMAVFRYFSEYPETFRMLVQRNPDPDVRKGAANLLIRALSVLREVMPPEEYGLQNEDEDILGEDTSYLSDAMRIIETLWLHFPGHLRSWNEVFGFMLSFVKLGTPELAAFLEEKHLETLLWIIVADPHVEKAGMPPQIHRLLMALGRRQASRPPNYETIIGLLDVVLANVRLPEHDPKSRYADYIYKSLPRRTAASGPPWELLPDEVDILTLIWSKGNLNIFTDHLINLGQNPQATDSIVRNLIQQNYEMQTVVFRVLRLGITGGVVSHTIANYLRVAGGVFCRFASNRDLIRELIKYVSNQTGAVHNSEGKEFLEFQRKVFDNPRERSGESLHEVIIAGLDNLPFWVPGLLTYYDTSVGEEVERFLHEKLFQPRIMPDQESAEGQALEEKVTATARRLGFQCLIYLRDKHIKRNAEITERAMNLMTRVIRVCGRYFNVDNLRDADASDFEDNRKSKCTGVFLLGFEQLANCLDGRYSR